METQGQRPNKSSPEEKMLDAALELAQWERAAIARLGARGELSFNRNSLDPDRMLHVILSCAQEIRDAKELDRNTAEQASPVS